MPTFKTLKISLFFKEPNINDHKKDLEQLDKMKQTKSEEHVERATDLREQINGKYFRRHGDHRILGNRIENSERECVISE